MSHELRDNIERRERILMAMNAKGNTRRDLENILIEHFGYNEKGARAKVDELVRIGMVIIRRNKFYPKYSSNVTEAELHKALDGWK